MGKRIQNPPILHFPKAVLFVCKGNICRSPYAGMYLRKITENRNLHGIRSRSAGLEVRISIPSPDLAVQVAKTLGVDLTDHRSIQVTEDIIEDSDIVFAMEHRQAVFLRRTFPAHVPKICLLPVFDSDPSWSGDHAMRYNIPDPYGKSEKDFLECFRMIERSIEGFLSRLEHHPRP